MRPLDRLWLTILVRGRRFVRTDANFLLILAALVGAAAAMTVIGFRAAAATIRASLWGWPTDLAEHAASVPWWHLLGFLTLGGALVGWLVERALKGRVYGVIHVVQAAADPKARLHSRPALLTALGGAISIGTGASIGREGVLVQLGAAMTVSLCRRLRLTPALSRTMMGAGVAAVMAAQFNAPLAGTFFALELVLGEHVIHSLAPTVVAAVVGTAISRYWYGDFPAFVVARSSLHAGWEFPLFALLGIVAAVVALGFMRNADLAASWFHRKFPARPLRTAFGGFCVGLLGLALPNVLGTGYPTISQVLAGEGTVPFLLALVLAKSMATSISVGSGFIGGDFSASLLLGSATGAVFGTAVHALLPGASDVQLYALIGMGAVAASVMGAPMTTILIISELTADYSITIAVMIAVVIATTVVQNVYGRSVVAWKLERRM
ncbi:MAG: Cl-channel, voltage gated [Rhodospirillales bacterium]|nr:Cl-channel, voltage gated [Rhodospirillales bacterium]